MLERLNKQKLRVQFYVAKYKSDHYSNITPEEWELVNDTFFFVTKECSKNNALLSIVIPHAKSMTKLSNLIKIQNKYKMFVKL